MQTSGGTATGRGDCDRDQDAPSIAVAAHQPAAILLLSDGKATSGRDAVAAAAQPAGKVARIHGGARHG